MKQLAFLAALNLVSLWVSAQSKIVKPLLADSVIITNCDSAELIIENHTQNIPGFLFNTGNGRTIFKRALTKLSDTVYLVGADTLKLNSKLWLQNGNYWGSTGILGSLDSNHVDFYTNKKQQVRITASGTLTTNNDALINGLTVGRGAGNNLGNTVVGFNALTNNPGNGASTAVGYQAGQYAKGSVTLLGYSAGINETGNGLTAIGQFAGRYFSGGYGIAIGDSSLGGHNNASGWFNVSVGHFSTPNLTSGWGNTVLGNYSGAGITTGSYNTIIGGQITGLSPTLSNSIIIGDGQGNQRLGVNNWGYFGVNNMNPNALFQVDEWKTGIGLVTNAAGGTTVNGQGTLFTQTFDVGDTITIGGQSVQITAITNDSLMSTTTLSSSNILQPYSLPGGTRMAVQAYGNVGIGVTIPTSRFDIASKVGHMQLRLRNSFTPASSSDPTGNIGDVAWDDNYLYVKTNNGWERAPLNSF